MTCSEASCQCAKFTLKAIFSSVGLCAIVVAYVLLGGYLFKLIEGRKELEDLMIDQERKEAQRGIVMANLSDYFTRHLARCLDPSEPNTMNQNRTCVQNLLGSETYNTLFQALLDVYDQEVFKAKNPILEGNDTNVKKQWTLGNSVLFSTTVITTIGYGNLVPKTKLGKFMCMVYALFGVPLMLITLASMGNFMATCFRFSYQRCCYPLSAYWMKLCQPKYKLNRRRHKNRNNIDLSRGPYEIGTDDESETGLSQTSSKPRRVTRAHKPREIPICLSLLVLISYLVGVSIMFKFWEGWDVLDAIYFCFITFSTIGFGDLVPGDSITSQKEENNYKSALCAVSVLFGLAIMSMCFNLMQDTLFSYFRSCCRKVRNVGESNDSKPDSVIPGGTSTTAITTETFSDSPSRLISKSAGRQLSPEQSRPGKKKQRPNTGKPPL